MKKRQHKHRFVNEHEEMDMFKSVYIVKDCKCGEVEEEFIGNQPEKFKKFLTNN